MLMWYATPNCTEYMLQWSPLLEPQDVCGQYLQEYFKCGTATWKNWSVLFLCGRCDVDRGQRKEKDKNILERGQNQNLLLIAIFFLFVSFSFDIGPLLLQSSFKVPPRCTSNQLAEISGKSGAGMVCYKFSIDLYCDSCYSF